MNQLQREIGQYLQNSGVGTLSLGIFLGQMPASPSTALAVIGTGGPRNRLEPRQLRRASVQVLSRSNDLAVARSAAETVFELIDGRWNILSTIKGKFTADHQVGPMYRDGSGFFVFTTNYSLVTVASTI